MRTIILLAVIFMASVASAKTVKVVPAPMPTVQQSDCIDNETLQWAPCAPTVSSKILDGTIPMPSMPDGPICKDPSLGVYKSCLPSPTPCETQLREALKAVERYLPWYYDPINTTLLHIPCDERCRLQSQLDALDRRDKVEAQYKAALKECGKP